MRFVVGFGFAAREPESLAVSVNCDDRFACGVQKHGCAFESCVFTFPAICGWNVAPAQKAMNDPGAVVLLPMQDDIVDSHVG